jgi:hypothetical protein
MYPAPQEELLQAHFQTSIFSSLSAAAEPLEDDDDDDLELPELPSIHNEAVRIWVNDPNRYPPPEWALDVEDKYSARVSKYKDVEVSTSFGSCGIV